MQLLDFPLVRPQRAVNNRVMQRLEKCLVSIINGQYHCYLTRFQKRQDRASLFPWTWSTGREINCRGGLISISHCFWLSWWGSSFMSVSVSYWEHSISPALRELSRAGAQDHGHTTKLWSQMDNQINSVASFSCYHLWLISQKKKVLIAWFDHIMLSLSFRIDFRIVVFVGAQHSVAIV